MGNLAIHALSIAGAIGVPFALGLGVLFGKGGDIVPDDAHAAEAAYEAEKRANARLQPFNGGAR